MQIKKYSDDQVREVLKKMVAASGGYRELAKDFRVDLARLHRMVAGKCELTEEVAEKAGFKAILQPARRWLREK